MDLDLRAVGFVVAVTAASTLLIGLMPALHAGRADVVVDLKEGSRGSGRRGRLGRLLVVSELALALVLLIGAALLVQSFRKRHQTDPGFDLHPALTARLALAGEHYADVRHRAETTEDLVRRLRALADVEQAGIANGLPFSAWHSGGWWQRRFEVEGRPVEPDKAPSAVYYTATSGYLEACGIRLRQGRFFDPAEEAEGRQVVVVSDDLARRFWSDVDPTGRRLRIAGGPWLRVVGVVQQTREAGDLVMAASKPPGQLYVPYRLDPWDVVSVVVRTRSDPASLAGPLRAALRSLDPHLPLDTVFTLDEVRARASWVAELWGRMMTQVAALALVLAALGVYGVVSHTVSQRTHEIGIRVALGAAPATVVRLVVRQGLRLALQSTALGLVGSLALTRGLASLLYGISASDPLTFMACAGVLVLAALAASGAPALRAARVDPLISLRAE
jgi:putative ABC transport system permease protein